MDAFDGGVELVECVAERAGPSIRVRVHRRCRRAKIRKIQLAVEERDAQTERREAVTVRAGCR